MCVAPGVSSDLSLACPGPTHSPASWCQDGVCPMCSLERVKDRAGGSRELRGDVGFGAERGRPRRGRWVRISALLLASWMTLGEAVSFLHLSLLICTMATGFLPPVTLQDCRAGACLWKELPLG